MEQDKYVTKYRAVDVEEYAALQAKCEKYEKALNEIAAPNLYTPDTWDVIAHNMISIANEALSREWQHKTDLDDLQKHIMSGKGDEDRTDNLTKKEDKQ